MRCTACGADTATLETRRRNGAIYRRRQCQECSERFSTRELPEAALKALQAQCSSLQRDREVLRRQLRRAAAGLPIGEWS
ncbi:MAG: hypothetical protein LW834_08105 [Cyanobium sp. 49614_E6]|jgi:transcriptional regulator NrdR family protein|nr:hypothetical protein [Cyanobium sp. 49614_E6]